jgi:DNA-binding MarR family transcriptional regulator
MKREKSVGFRTRTLSVAIKRAVEAGKAKHRNEKCTGTHGWVIGYLYDNRDSDVYQRDIEKHFSVSRPTMTEILKLMEKNGLVERVRDERDSRLKRIELTPLALEIHERHERDINNFEEFLRKGITEEEMNIFFSVMEKIESNVRLAEAELKFGEPTESEE